VGFTSTGIRPAAASGLCFGTSKPAVTLDEMSLAVTSFGPTAIQATLPSPLQPGSYHLTVVTGPGAPWTGELDVTIGNAGPQGPAGATGPQGPRWNCWNCWNCWRDWAAGTGWTPGGAGTWWPLRGSGVHIE